MNVSDIMTREVHCVNPEETLYDAALKMKHADAGAVPVTQDRDVLGILTDRDIVVRAVAEGVDPKMMTVREAMTDAPVTCRPDCPVEDAAMTMRDRQIRRLVVTEEHNRDVVGIISLGDIAVRGELRELVGEVTHGVCQPAGVVAY